MFPRPLRRHFAAFARAVPGVLALVFAVLATGALELVPRANAPETWCCCAEVGIDARCTCSGDCCRHTPTPRAPEALRPSPLPDGAACLDARCRRPEGIAKSAVVLEPFVAPVVVYGVRATGSTPLAGAVLRCPAQRRLAAPERPPARAIA
ncbi:MAG: hypothetical protein U0704_08730 [Candidatus Eisenbacteria bacterium]